MSTPNSISATRAEAKAVLEALSLEDADSPDHCIVRRTVTAEGRSRAFVNGAPCNLQVLRDLTGALVDLHGQHDNLRLADADIQLALLDDYGGCSVEAAEVAKIWRELQSKRRQATALQSLLDRDADRAALLRYQLEELSALALEAGEFERLEAELKRLSKVDTLRANAEDTLSVIEGQDALRGAVRRLGELDDDQATLTNAQQTLKDALALLDDAQAELRRYSEGLEQDPARLEQVSSRLSEVHQLARKHQVRPEALADRGAELEGELTGMRADSSALTDLSAAIEALDADFDARAQALSKHRRKAAKRFDAAVSKTVQQLALPKASLESRFESERGEHGLDRYSLVGLHQPEVPSGATRQHRFRRRDGAHIPGGTPHRSAHEPPALPHSGRG